MRFLKRFAQGELRLNRIEAFSDGVFAIVVTLLVLELGVPILDEPSSVNELGHQLVDLVPKFLSWLISFIIVCKVLVKSSPSSWVRSSCHLRNGLAELDLSNGPGVYPISDRADGRVSNEFFGRESLWRCHGVNTLLFISLQFYILRNLIKPEMISEKIPHLTRRSFIGVVSYLLGVAAGWFNVHAAFVLYALTPLFFITLPQPVASPNRE